MVAGSSGTSKTDTASPRRKNHGKTAHRVRGATSHKTRIAVLGGGAAALAAVFGITSSPRWQDRFEVTVLQMGWRLGGKCASSREPNYRHRNHEHGFHILGGFYHNSMRMLRDCYAEWKNPPDDRKFPDCALTPHNLVHLMQLRNGRWEPQMVPFPERSGEFGDDEIALTPYEMTRAIWDWVKRSMTDPNQNATELHPHAQTHIDALDQALPDRDPLHLADDHVSHLTEHVSALHAHVVKAAPRATQEQRFGTFDYTMMLQIGLIIMRGIIADGIWRHGFDCINDKEFSDWLRLHGASDAVVNSPYIQGGYDYAFAYEDGDFN